ncbi:hypothetical protein EBB54_15960 [Schaedlerella arabinosiphila]|jgi:hypothetical protein|uniref:Uncharacterized protein n=1 Tax=Schaedlerella arabinosiphila TaxID=2044587 RepID=A0A426DIT7_9FIRM|nr:hypothetical protein [Schaedlerella arabinosiphila]RRK32686.1 hypothetical protein EBB54_15960 [Schaedlerella arabinosiphila]
MLQKPYIPYDSERIKKILKCVGKTIADIISIIGKKVSSIDSIDEKSSVSDVDNLIEIFETYKEETRKKTSEIEESVYAEVSSFTEELEILFDDRETLIKKYGISRKRIARQIHHLLAEVRGYIDNEVCKSITLSNQELRDVIRMIPGNQKEQAMNEFADRVFREALDTYCQHIREELSVFFEEIEEGVLSVIEAAKETADRNSRELENINADNCEEQSERIIANANDLIIDCSVAEYVLKG